MIDNIQITLVETSHPGNIGAAARAMKTMGRSRLCLVRPKYFPNAEATARASGADDILLNARLVDSLDEALENCHLVVGASNRPRTIGAPVLDARSGAQRLVTTSRQGCVALLFGREHSGLSNRELDRCHFQLTIPAVEDFPSLNIAAAVQIMAYELRLAGLSRGSGAEATAVSAVTMDEMERFYHHLERVLVAIEFLDPDNPRHLMRRLRRLYNRLSPDCNEMNILRGILTAVQKQIATRDGRQETADDITK